MRDWRGKVRGGGGEIPETEAEGKCSGRGQWGEGGRGFMSVYKIGGRHIGLETPCNLCYLVKVLASFSVYHLAFRTKP